MLSFWFYDKFFNRTMAKSIHCSFVKVLHKFILITIVFFNMKFKFKLHHLCIILYCFKIYYPLMDWFMFKFMYYNFFNFWVNHTTYNLHSPFVHSSHLNSFIPLDYFVYFLYRSIFLLLLRGLIV